MGAVDGAPRQRRHASSKLSMRCQRHTLQRAHAPAALRSREEELEREHEAPLNDPIPTPRAAPAPVPRPPETIVRAASCWRSSNAHVCCVAPVQRVALDDGVGRVEVLGPQPLAGGVRKAVGAMARAAGALPPAARRRRARPRPVLIVVARVPPCADAALVAAVAAAHRRARCAVPLQVRLQLRVHDKVGHKPEAVRHGRYGAPSMRGGIRTRALMSCTTSLTRSPSARPYASRAGRWSSPPVRTAAGPARPACREPAALTWP